MVIGIFIAQITQTFLGLYIPTLNAVIIDKGIAVGDVDTIWKTGSVMLLLTLVNMAAVGITVYLSVKLSMGIGNNLRRSLFTKVCSFSPSDLRFFGAATLITRNTNDVTQIQSTIQILLQVALAAPIMGIGGVILTLSKDLSLAIILAVLIPLITLFYLVLLSKMMPKFVLRQKIKDKLNLILREQLTGSRVIRAFNKQIYERNRFDAANKEMQSVSIKIAYIFALIMPFWTLALGGSWVVLYWLGGYRIENGYMQVGSITAVVSYLSQIMISVMVVAMVSAFFPQGIVAAKRIKKVLDTQSSFQSLGIEKKPPEQIQGVKFKNISLRFEGAEENVITDIDLELYKGKTLGIIGALGSGKSQLINLLLRFVDPSSGEVLLLDKEGGEFPYLQLNQISIRKHFAFMPQKTYLFSGTVASNIACIEPEEVTEKIKERVWKALEAAQARDFVENRPEKLEAKVVGGGDEFSGGQKARISLARALYKVMYEGAEFLVIDDGFAALDTETESRIQHNLQVQIADTAKVFVSQKITTLMNADEILVLDAGKIIGRGKHKELLQSCAEYKEIADLQIEGSQA